MAINVAAVQKNTSYPANASTSGLEYSWPSAHIGLHFVATRQKIVNKPPSFACVISANNSGAS
jgi:hypothetical protein